MQVSYNQGCLRTPEEGLRQTRDQDGAEATQDTETDLGSPKRCHPKHAEIKRGLLHPVRRVPSHLRRRDKEEAV